MAEVTGSIGSEHVELNNAATEATLNLLYQATLRATKQTHDDVSKMAQKAGIDPKVVAQVGEAYSATEIALAKTRAGLGAFSSVLGGALDFASGFTPLLRDITSGVGSASKVLNDISVLLPPGLSQVANGLSQLASIQEEYLGVYRKITDSGINFAGSLTDMRLAAAEMNLTLPQFQELISKNGQALARMGENAEDGAKNFRMVSSEFAKNPIMKDMLALGYTVEDVNQGMINFIAATGGRTKKEMANTDAIIQSTGMYLQELDLLTQFTGTSRKKQEEEQKKAELNNAYQRKLQQMEPAERAKVEAARQMAALSGVEGATDLVMGRVLGSTVPLTEASRMLAGISPQVSDGFTELAGKAMSSSSTMGDLNNKFLDIGKAAVSTTDQFGDTGDMIVMMGGKFGGAINSLDGFTNRINQRGPELEAGMNAITNQQAEQQKSQAAAASALELNLKKLGAEVIKPLMDVFSSLLPVVTGVTNTLASVAGTLAEWPKTVAGVGIALTGLITVFAAAKARLAVQAVGDIVGGRGAGGVAGAIGSGGARGVAGAVGAAETGAGGGLAGLGKGIQSIGMSLAALGPEAPLILAGAAAIGGAIVAIGAGIAGATWLISASFPKLVGGLKSFEELNGDNLVSASKGIAAIGAGLLAFGAVSGIGTLGGVIGGLIGKFGGLNSTLKDFAEMGPGLQEAGLGLKDINSALSGLLYKDYSNIDKAIDSLSKLRDLSKEANPRNSARIPTKVSSEIIKEEKTKPTVETKITSVAEGEKTPTQYLESMATSLITLNTNMESVLKYTRDTAEHSGNNVKATRSLLGDLFK